jgi:tetraacyldisaccharide 4'-kinase
VGIVSRGHGRQSQQVLSVHPDSLAHEVGDEPLLLARSTGVPVFVGAQRAQAAGALLAQHPETEIIVCDDGLQHLALARDVEVLVMDERGIGNGWLLPAGPLREPWPRKADLLLHSGACPALAQTPSFAMHRQLANYAVNAYGDRTPLASLQGLCVHALAGIARPEAFFDMLREQGLQLATTRAWPDHADFGAWKAPAGNGTIVCTEKDAVKLWPNHPEVLAVPLLLDIPASFNDALDRLLAQSPTAKPL